MRPNILTLLLAIFTVSVATAQLYDNRSRYLKTPYDVDRFERNLNTFRKPTRQAYYGSTQNYYRRNYSNYRTKSYNNYNSRVYSYTKPSYGSSEFYYRFRDPIVLNSYASKGVESEFKLKDCHCNYRNDINNAYQQWYQNQKLARATLLRNYEALFEKKIEKLLNKQFPNFKSAQKAFYKDYGKIHHNEYMQRISNMNSIDLYQKQLEFDRAKSYYKFFDYVKEQNDFYYRRRSYRGRIDRIADLIINGQSVRRRSGSLGANRKLYNTSNLNALYNNIKNSYKDFLISKKIFKELNRNSSLFYDYLSEKYVEHYENQSNYEYKLGAFNGYIEHYQNRVGYGTILKPTHSYHNYMLFNPINETELKAFLKKHLAKNIDYTYRGSLPTIETAIANVAVHELDEFNSRELSLIHYNRLINKEHKKRLYEKIKQAVLNKKTLKNAAIQYFKNVISIDNLSIQSLKDAVGSRLENKPFKWDELENMPYFRFQQKTNTNVLFTLDLKVKRVWKGRTSRGGAIARESEYFKYKGIADVLKHIYDVEKYWGVEGATMRHFLKEKGLNVPSSLSNYDLGKLFDFGGGNSNTLTIEFSDYAKKFITNFQHYDGKYGTSLFTDLVKLKKLYDILKGRPVDFSNNKKPCIGDPVPNPEIAPQKNSGIQGGMHDTWARWNEKTICKGVKGRKWHNGIDIKNPPGAPIYAIYDGIASKHTQYKDGKIVGAGYYSVIKSKVNGKNVRMVYFHLQDDNRTTGVVKAGDIIGYQGDSGNLKNAIGQGHTVSHVHIKTQVNGANDDPLNHIKTKIDPKTGKVINRCN